MFGEKELLKRGADSQEVASLQKTLINMGYDVGPVDGKFGPKTAAAVEKFQDDHHLQSDGIVGPTTGAALDHYYKQKLQAQKGAQVQTSAKTMPTKGGVATKGAQPAAKTASSPKLAKAGVKTAAKEKDKGGGLTGFGKDDDKKKKGGGLTGFGKD